MILNLILSFAALAEPRFARPVIESVIGKAQVVDAQGKPAAAKHGLKLREKVTLQTPDKAWVMVDLAKDEKLIVAPDSLVKIPVISWEDGSVERIELEKGAMRLVNLTSRPRLVVTPLSRDPYSEGDLVFQYDERNKSLKLSVLDGKALFRGQEDEEFLTLGSGESASFQAVLEKGELVYDVLLHDRRVIRGQMSEKSAIPEAQKKLWQGAFAKAEAAHKAAQKKARQEKARSGSICKTPAGRVNECAWVCENNPKGEKKRCRLDLEKVRCVRLKCDANGQWSDRLELMPSQSPCDIRPIVRACDY